MKFLVDAQLPRRLVSFLQSAGHDCLHTSELELGNRTPDSDIAKRADNEGRVVITKDRDFWIGHLLDHCPQSLLIVATGNIANSALLGLFETHIDEIVDLLSRSSVVELGRDRAVAHAYRRGEAE
ncbi:DUF5615 family PIN-like protein [Nocardia cyriacigeorgica]|uniref:DUF5615 family PIN-like protein n=1 Tax=Nocardia cyriacigeorgica TaxID=135487 RepID=UPI001892E2E0|nr:DUF5615 family PIN-like protein [Nocardia cyriacigeorgica]MBF6319306.1 DUF5615 family PIN-like protein [Nocardia cyriacigeorgica]MBF6343386.1 DUF5615 family PIN-like protein [Nocardia cyriacigeorgica]MBF6516067.1 DUF5615 family PIN-like protein [Nocardia cyriacigeorgica]MBF6535324.1 DUF5615 family PIN-like protein [Nocardia cyriacigeorgica]